MVDSTVGSEPRSPLQLECLVCDVGCWSLKCTVTSDASDVPLFSSVGDGHILMRVLSLECMNIGHAGWGALMTNLMYPRADGCSAPWFWPFFAGV